MKPHQIKRYLTISLAWCLVSCSTFSGATEQDLIKSPCANNETEERVYQQMSLNANQNLFLDCARSSTTTGDKRLILASGR